MTDDQRRVPIKVRVVDKRKTNPEPNADQTGPSDTSSAAPSAPFTQSVFEGSHSSAKGGSADASGVGGNSVREGATSSEGEALSSVDAGVGSAEPDDSGASADGAPSAAVEAGEQEENQTGVNRDYLDDLRRVQAEFDNFRKRTFKERQHAESRGKRLLVEHLLPVLDNFERAIAHGEGGGGVELVFRELKSTLESEGLAEIPAEGQPFDPQVHEAVESVEDPEVDHAMVTQVYRRGYSFGGDVVRPAMVVVARPVEETTEQPEAAGGS